MIIHFLGDSKAIEDTHSALSVSLHPSDGAKDIEEGMMDLDVLDSLISHDKKTTGD